MDWRISRVANEPIPVFPNLQEPIKVTLTDEQLWQIWQRIELIDAHFEACCAFQLDKCDYDNEYNELYRYLHLAGVEQWRTPFDRDDFEAWINGKR